MNDLETDLRELKIRIASIAHKHEAEIAKTAHVIYSGNRMQKSSWPLSRSFAAMEDAVNECIETYEGANGVGTYAPTDEQLREVAIEHYADSRSQR